MFQEPQLPPYTKTHAKSLQMLLLTANALLLKAETFLFAKTHLTAAEDAATTNAAPANQKNAEEAHIIDIC